MMNMSDRIRQRRKELNLTQQALADLAGVNRVTVTGWEKDDYQPNGANLQALANALKCDPLWLVSGKGSPEPKLNLKPEIFSVKKVPLISWVQAGSWTMTDHGVKEDDAEPVGLYNSACIRHGICIESMRRLNDESIRCSFNTRGLYSYR